MIHKYSIGIDPGLNGGIVIISKDISIINMYIMPTLEKKVNKKKKRKIDKGKLNKIILDIKNLGDIFVYLERVGAMKKGKNSQGSVSMFTFGEGYGILQGILFAHKISEKFNNLKKVAPISWTKNIRKEITESNTKKRSRMFLNKYYPSVFNKFILPKCRVPHEGLVDAFLIARYGLLKTKSKGK